MIFFLKVHSLNVIFFQNLRCDVSPDSLLLSLESLTAKYSRAIMVANYFYPKIEGGKVSGFVCLSESVVQLTIDSLPPTPGVAVPKLKALEFWPAFLIL